MTALFWHRRDLRNFDNTGLFHALTENKVVHPIFIFDKNIIEKLPRDDQRILFIHQEILALKKSYKELGSDLQVYYGNPQEIIPKIALEKKCSAVYFNKDYEPYARERDKIIFDSLTKLNIDFKGSKDHVIFEKNEITKDDGKPYTVFTPYSKKWKSNLTADHFKAFPSEKFSANLVQTNNQVEVISLADMGFESKIHHAFPERLIQSDILKNYHLSRNFPAENGTSRLSLHLRFGTISIRALAKSCASINETYLNELIWRDFYQMIIFHFPNSAENAFKIQYDRIVWERNEAQFDAWCKGKTGYPIVDAGMRELNATGFMHNRVRMIVASFLTKHLLIDWRWGATYFAEKLLDFELASNAGGWQWAASCGCDAAPYFRVFNPQTQQEKFDKHFEYIKKWVPEYGTDSYSEPIIEHKFARERVLQRFKSALNENNA